MLLYIIRWGGKLRYVLAFFRDTLNGTTYFVVAFVCLILICFCIYILKRISLSEKELLKKEMESKVVLVDSSGSKGKIEVSFANVDVGDTGTQAVTNVTSVLANQDIYSDNVTTDTLSTTSESTVEEKKEEVSEKKAPIMINPDEVALVSSDMNLIGSSEELATIKNSNSATTDIISNVNPEINNSATGTEQR